MPAPLAKLLIVDDETAQMTALCKTLQLEGYETVGFSWPPKRSAHCERNRSIWCSPT